MNFLALPAKSSELSHLQQYARLWTSLKGEKQIMSNKAIPTAISKEECRLLCSVQSSIPWVFSDKFFVSDRGFKRHKLTHPISRVVEDIADIWDVWIARENRHSLITVKNENKGKEWMQKKDTWMGLTGRATHKVCCWDLD